MNKILKIGITFILLTLLLTGCGTNKTDDKNKNTNNNNDINIEGIILPDKEVSGVKMISASITYDNGISTVVVSIQNTNQSDKEIEFLKIKLLGKNKETIYETNTYVGATLKQNEIKQVKSEITKDLTKAEDVEYEIY